MDLGQSIAIGRGFFLQEVTRSVSEGEKRNTLDHASGY
jgi:hypothetical protein